MSDDEGAVGGRGEASNGTDADRTAETDDGSTGGTETEPIESIADRIAANDLEETAREITSLRSRCEELERKTELLAEERSELEERLKRKQAEFQNYKKRQKKRREEEKKRATEELTERLLEVRDNLDRALDTEEDADIREGVEATRRLLDDILDAEGVERITPQPGAELDPQRHEALMRVESDQPAGTIAELHRPGYELGGKLLRAAQVTVSAEE
ncbi:MAG: nucleotide exchange factor GrpE [Natronomonas sp.]